MNPLVVFVLLSASVMTLQEKCRLGAWLALNVAREAPPLKVPSPDTPAGETCTYCGGTGVLPGDSVIKPICQACDGTGKRKPADFDSKASVQALKKAEAVAKAPKPMPAPPGPGTWRKVCNRDGSGCHWERVD